MSNSLPDWSQPSPVQYQSPAAGGILLTPQGLALLRKIRPWTLFLAVMGFISTVLTVGFAILLLLAALIKGAPAVAPGAGPDQSPFFLALLCLVNGIIYLLLSVMSLRISLAIGRLLSFGTPENLDEVIAMQHRFWRMVGVITIIFTVLMILSIFAGVFLALAGVGRPV